MDHVHASPGQSALTAWRSKSLYSISCHAAYVLTCLLHLPQLFFGAYFYGDMRIGNWIRPASKQPSGALKGTLFVGNMLYLGITGNVMMLFNCQPLGTGSYGLTFAPNVMCYEGKGTCVANHAFTPFS